MPSESPRRIYCDYNATAPPLRSALRAVAGCCGHGAFGNPGSAHTEGHRAEFVVEGARAQVAALIGAEPEEIVFTSGGTEADNLAVGSAPEGHGIVTTAVEHKAVLSPVEALVSEGADVGIVGVDGYGWIDPRRWDRALQRHRPGLVSMMLANNEIGNLYDAGGLTRLSALSGSGPFPHGAVALRHTDAVNALGKVRIDVGLLGVDLLSMSAHKIGGLKGVGALYVRGGPEGPIGKALRPSVLGGGQEHGLRSGTLNVPGIAAFGAAAYAMRRFLTRGGYRHLDQTRSAMESAFGGFDREGRAKGIRGVRRLGDPDPQRRLPNTLTIEVKGVPPQELVAALDRRGVAASAGSACSCKEPKPSHVMEAIGASEGGVRFSMGPGTSIEDGAEAGRRCVEAIHNLRRGRP